MDFHGLKKIGFPVLTTGCVLSGVSCIDQTPRDLANMNIILFMVDDMGLNDTQVPFLDGGSTLNQYYYTPNMVRLAEKGVRFTSAYACPVSSPTRVSLMTGSNAARHRVTNWTLDMNVNTDSFGGNNALTSQNWNYNGISPDLGSDATQDNIYESTCFPEVLRQNGYRTIHLGKAHWGAVGTLAAEPLNLGFDVNIGGCAAGGLASYTIPNEDASYSFSADGRLPFPLINQYAEKKSNYHMTDAITKAAKSEIDKCLKENRKFYMYVSHYAVHSPYEEDSRFSDLYPTGSQTTRNYGTLITGMDRSLGELMDYLEKKRIDDNTIVIFMADNGGHHWNKNTPLKGSKGSLWEGGIHEPMMVYWPGVTDAYAGQTNDSPVIIEDFFPTILEMANIKESSYASRLKQVIDGQSFVAALRGNKLINTERQLIFHYPNRWGEATTLDGNAIGEPSSAIIEGGWKYIYFYNDNSEFLYNLNNDETEQINLAASESVKKEEMAQKLSDYLKSVDATMVYNPQTMKITYPDQSVVDIVQSKTDR